MANTFFPIATATVLSASATITFTSISQSYTDLFITSQLRTTVAGNNSDIVYYLNGDGAASTNYSRIWTSSGTTSNGYSTGVNYNFPGLLTSYCAGGSATSGQFSADEIVIYNYSNTTTFKPFTAKFTSGNIPNAGTHYTIGQWANPSKNAISSIQLATLDGSNFAVNSTISIYGILAA
jgi:hypothetical protein